MGNLKKIGIGSAQKIAGSRNRAMEGFAQLGAPKISNERSRLRLSSCCRPTRMMYYYSEN